MAGYGCTHSRWMTIDSLVKLKSIVDKNSCGISHLKTNHNGQVMRKSAANMDEMNDCVTSNISSVLRKELF